MPKYIQAWEFSGPEFNGFVYDQQVALRKLGEQRTGAMITITIVRHENGDREYLRGTIASEVEAYREGVSIGR